MIANTLREGYHRAKWALVLRGVIGLVLGVLFGLAALYFYPALSLTFAVVWAGIWLLTTGAMGIYLGVQERRAGLSSGWTMTWGSVGLIIGILAFVYPQITLIALMSLIATFGIVGGIAMLVGAGRLQHIEQDFTHRATHATGD